MAAPVIVAENFGLGTPVVTMEEFMSLALDRAELVDGKIVEKEPPNFDHGEIAAFVAADLLAFVRKNGLGRVTIEGPFRTVDGRIRAPDVAFLSHAELEGENTAGLIMRAPTLAVEILSPNDTYLEVEEKAEEYLAAGCRLIWIVNPPRRTVTVRTSDSEVRIYHVGEALPGGSVLPGFELPVADLFSN